MGDSFEEVAAEYKRVRRRNMLICVGIAIVLIICGGLDLAILLNQDGEHGFRWYQGIVSGLIALGVAGYFLNRAKMIAQDERPPPKA